MPFQGGSFFVHEGMPYCEIHYHAKRGSLCAGCHKPITGRKKMMMMKMKTMNDMSHINPFKLGWANYFKMMKMMIDTSGTSFRIFITAAIDGKPSGTSFRWLFTVFLRHLWDIIL